MHLMGTAITVSKRDTWKRIVPPNPRAWLAKAKVKAVFINVRKIVQRTRQLTDLICVHFETIVMNRVEQLLQSGTLDSGAAVSGMPKSLGDDHPMQIEEPRSYRTATGSLVQDVGFRVLTI